jgi:hypothetical protein
MNYEVTFHILLINIIYNDTGIIAVYYDNYGAVIGRSIRRIILKVQALIGKAPRLTGRSEGVYLSPVI